MKNPVKARHLVKDLQAFTAQSVKYVASLLKLFHCLSSVIGNSAEKILWW